MRCLRAMALAAVLAVTLGGRTLAATPSGAGGYRLAPSESPQRVPYGPPGLVPGQGTPSLPSSTRPKPQSDLNWDRDAEYRRMMRERRAEEESNSIYAQPYRAGLYWNPYSFYAPTGQCYRREPSGDLDRSCVPAAPPYSLPSVPPESQRLDTESVSPANRSEVDEAARKASEESLRALSIAEAKKYLASGDEFFAKRNYVMAKNRYRSALICDPGLVDAWFHQGFAFAAMGRYDLAATVIRQGLKLNSAWPKSAFRTDNLFADAAAKAARLDAMILTLLDKPTDADRLFFLGVHLHFDGRSDVAAALFDRAKRAGGKNSEHIEAFLTEK
jgi:tetratricopeptide (TPR) repeat protein